ncbi:Glucanosyltransferase-domain-containing protein [Peziza echinospora]|nr:Glucanosyltransferase-domain-containing protein [Peziza echinospora]
MRLSVLAVAMAMSASVVSAIDLIEIKGRHFYNKATGDPFFIKGVDYQPGGSSGFKTGADPLSDPDKCARDIYLFQKLGINTIRVYSVDPEVNHDKCMTLLAAAGIYLVLDVNSPLLNQHLHDLEPWTTYTQKYLEHVFQVIEVFSGYDNTLAFLAGNEVVHTAGSEKVVPRYLKALVRDMKGYITNHIHRIIPVGYSNADHVEFRVSLAEYLSCGSVGYIDFFAVNSYQWCGKNTFSGSGYDVLVNDYGNYSLPIFFSEYGCNLVRPRIFQETEALFSDKMTGVFSGGLIYEFTNETANYGIVQMSTNGKDATILPEFDTLQKVHAAASSPKIPSGATENPRITKCQPKSYYWNITGDSDLPDTLGASFIKDGVTKGKWVKGKFLEEKDLTLSTTSTIKDTAGKEVTDKKVKVVASIKQDPIPSGGHGLNTGGGVGEGYVPDSPDNNNGTSGNNTDSAAGSVQFAFGTVLAGALAAALATL